MELELRAAPNDPTYKLSLAKGKVKVHTNTQNTEVGYFMTEPQFTHLHYGEVSLYDLFQI